MAKRKSRHLSRKKIRATAMKVLAKSNMPIHCSGALIGGGLFAYIGIDGYKTKDLDFAAPYKIEDGTFTLSPDAKNKASWNDNGHYIVDGVHVDWICKLDDGTGALFREACECAINVDGVWCAPLRLALAIRLAACREKDTNLIVRFVRAGVIDRLMWQEIVALVIDYAGSSRGADWLRAREYRMPR